MSSNSTTESQTSALPAAGVYTIDPVHSSVSFIVRHLIAAKVRGQFTDFSGTITVGETPESSSVVASVKADSITTSNEMRDNHLRSSDFLDQTNHPTLDFISSAVSAKANGRFELVGDLTIRGVTKTVTFDLEFLGSGASMTPGGTVVGFEATTEIDRRDFGVEWQGTVENGSVVVGNKVTLELSVEAHSQS